MERRISHVRFVDAGAVHRAVRWLAGQCDGAERLDGAGFNKNDSFDGHQWAQAEKLMDEQALLCRVMLRKYKRQFVDSGDEAREIWRAMWK